MAIDTPVQAMKKLHESKDKLVSSLVGTVKHEGESDADAIARLKSVSNQKLLRMSAVAKQVTDRGGREKVVSAIGDAMGRAKDSDYLTKLGSFSNGKLMDVLRSAEKRAK
ncbi:MAG: hypothetical protein GY811_14390 [Myxococcales bacterium]|nr:hypothetical protein [Myxococcales bacterium]